MSGHADDVKNLIPEATPMTGRWYGATDGRAADEGAHTIARQVGVTAMVAVPEPVDAVEDPEWGGGGDGSEREPQSYEFRAMTYR